MKTYDEVPDHDEVDFLEPQEIKRLANRIDELLTLEVEHEFLHITNQCFYVDLSHDELVEISRALRRYAKRRKRR